MNALKTGFLLAVIGAIAVGIGAFFFRLEGAIIGLGVALVIQGVTYFKGADMALSMARARPLQLGEVPWLEDIAAKLAVRANIPVPKLFVSPDPQPNAFAAGRDPEHSVVCVNVGLLQALNHNEVAAVLGHEFGHIKNRDTLTMTVAAACASMVSLAAQLGFWFGLGGGDRDRNPFVQLLIFLLAPFTATMIQLAISRTREFAADRESAELLGGPQPMIAALQRLDQTVDQIPSRTAQSSTAHMYIASPFKSGGLMNLFQTHPSMDERIKRLRALA